MISSTKEQYCYPVRFDYNEGDKTPTFAITARKSLRETDADYDDYFFPTHSPMALSDYNIHLSTGNWGAGWAPGIIHGTNFARGEVDVVCKQSGSSISSMVVANNHSVVLVDLQSSTSVRGVYIAPTDIDTSYGRTGWHSGWWTKIVGEDRLDGWFYAGTESFTPIDASSVSGSNPVSTTSLYLKPYVYNGRTDLYSSFHYIIESQNAIISGGCGPCFGNQYTSIAKNTAYIRSGYNSAYPSNYVYTAMSFYPASSTESSTDNRQLLYPFVYATPASGAEMYVSIRAAMCMTSYVKSC